LVNKLVAAFLSIDEHERSYKALAVSIDSALRQREIEVRERAVRIVDLKAADYDGQTAHVLRAVAGAIRRDSEA
jgi:hypothetical protein